MFGIKHVMNEEFKYALLMYKNIQNDDLQKNIFEKNYRMRSAAEECDQNPQEHESSEDDFLDIHLLTGCPKDHEPPIETLETQP